MPFSPECVDTIVALGDSSFEGLCRSIDEFLIEMTRVKHHPMAYGVADLTRGRIDMVITMYTDIGWTVKLVYDDRDGNFLHFERRT